MNKKITLFLILFLLNKLYSQDSTNVIQDTLQVKKIEVKKQIFTGYINNYSFSKVGIFGGFSKLNHLASFSVLPGSNDCGMFDKGSGFGYFAGAFINYSIFEELLSIQGKVGYEYQPFNLEKITDSYQVYNPVINDYQNLVLNNVANGAFNNLFFSFGIESKPFDLPVFFNLNFNILDANFGADYSITQNIESPLLYSFNDGKKSRNITQTSFTNSTAISIAPSISYEFAINNDYFFAPFFEYNYSFSSTVKETEWNIQSYKLGISFYSKLYKYPPPPPEPEKIDTLVIPIVEEKKEEPVIVKVEEPKIPEINLNSEPIKFTETIVTQTYPILPYIFFDSLKTEIKNLYIHNYSSDFSEKNLPKSTLEIYYHILDVIGSRLKSNPNIKIKLNGTTDGIEGESDDERNELALKRAKSVAEFFISEWDINPKRIEIKSSIIPKLKTDSDFEESNQENRRVEISSNDLRLLEPVIHSKFQEFKTNSNELDIRISKSNSENLSNEFFLKLYSSEKVFFENKLFEIPENFKINLNDQKLISNIEKNPNDIFIEISYKDKQERNYISKLKIEPNISKEQFELGRLNLIVFDFNKSILSNFNQNVINEFIDKAISPKSEVNITGSTDKLGEIDYNMKLSQSRANSVYDFMKEKREDINFKNIIGIGNSKLLIDNNLPEGRFYSRTVLIESKTPLK